MYQEAGNLTDQPILVDRITATYVFGFDLLIYATTLVPATMLLIQSTEVVGRLYNSYIFHVYI